MAGKSLSHGKSEHADRKVAANFLFIQQRWDPGPLLFRFLPGVGTRCRHRAACCSWKWALEVKHQQEAGVSLRTASGEGCGSPVLGQVGMSQPAFLLGPGGSCWVAFGSTWQDAEGAAPDEGVEQRWVDWTKQVQSRFPKRAVERERIKGIAFCDYKIHIYSL